MKLRNMQLKSSSTFPYIRRVCVQNYVMGRDRLEFEKKDNQNIIISIYRNMSISDNGSDKVTYATTLNNKFSVEVYRPKNNASDKAYLGWVQEITIILNANKIKRIFNIDTSYLETKHFVSSVKLPDAFERSITDIFANQSLISDNEHFEQLLSDLLVELELGRMKIIKTNRKMAAFKIKSVARC